MNKRTARILAKKSNLAKANLLLTAAAAMLTQSTIDDQEAIGEIRNALRMIDSALEDVLQAPAAVAAIEE